MTSRCPLSLALAKYAHLSPRCSSSETFDAFTNAGNKLFKDPELAAILLLYLHKEKGFRHEDNMEVSQVFEIWSRKMPKFIRIVVEQTDLDENRVCLIIKSIAGNLSVGKKIRSSILAEVALSPQMEHRLFILIINYFFKKTE